MVGFDNTGNGITAEQLNCLNTLEMELTVLIGMFGACGTLVLNDVSLFKIILIIINYSKFAVK